MNGGVTTVVVAESLYQPPSDLLYVYTSSAKVSTETVTTIPSRSSFSPCTYDISVGGFVMTILSLSELLIFTDAVGSL